jgi:hypothetical protein
MTMNTTMVTPATTKMERNRRRRMYWANGDLQPGT